MYSVVSEEGESMNIYTFLSLGYDLLDVIWFSDKGRNPRDVIENLIPNKECKVLDMCCGTFSNGLPIAKKNPKNLVIGLDRSKAMLREASTKIQSAGLQNVKLLCRDAAQTGLKPQIFDYIILGLVLHECDSDLWQGILSEAHRLLKPDGKLIILEWDKQVKFSRKLKFSPLYVMEAALNNKYFKEFYHSDKAKFFAGYGFRMLEKHDCNYTAVMKLQYAPMK
ncbi:MAG: class I SAM-dependent methyltransferase [Oscillospiraceae bacterium]|nr:class I SAM-dependent methyltransferase [Oscillospiraceae bacterium]